mgnify:CR=1 FL=1
MNFHLFRRSGPSPRIRGELALQQNSVATCGTIPANTGRIISITRVNPRPWDHPREYGENANIEPGLLRVEGPSPRIRGELSHPDIDGELERTIPANTGRILGTRRVQGDRRDHPREYGENSSCSVSAARAAGPSPRIRGEYCVEQRKDITVGTIPANTGRIDPWANMNAALRDHPREYGENNGTSLSGARCKGPSPRIRGEYGWF